MLSAFSQNPGINTHLFCDQKYLNKTASVSHEKGCLQKLNFHGFLKKKKKKGILNQHQQYFKAITFYCTLITLKTATSYSVSE